MNVKRSVGENIFDIINSIFMLLMIFVTIYPFVYVIFASFSDASRLAAHEGAIWWPIGFDTKGYKLVLHNPLIYTGYANTIFYVVVGTALNLVMTSLAAFALSRKRFLLKKVIMKIIIFTMFFGGGLIPSFLLVKGLGLYNSRLALIIPGAMSTWNMIVMRTSFMSIPDSLEEAAKIDGANDFTILFRIVLPLSKAVLAVMTLFYAVGHWNQWFNALIYLQDTSKHPLQLVLRSILISNSDDAMSGGASFGTSMDIVIKYACIIVSTVPILCIYPFLQKYFTKGVMIGAIKE